MPNIFGDHDPMDGVSSEDLDRFADNTNLGFDSPLCIWLTRFARLEKLWVINAALNQARSVADAYETLLFLDKQTEEIIIQMAERPEGVRLVDFSPGHLKENAAFNRLRAFVGHERATQYMDISRRMGIWCHDLIPWILERRYLSHKPSPLSPRIVPSQQLFFDFLMENSDTKPYAPSSILLSNRRSCDPAYLKDLKALCAAATMAIQSVSPNKWEMCRVSQEYIFPLAGMLWWLVKTAMKKFLYAKLWDRYLYCRTLIIIGRTLLSAEEGSRPFPIMNREVRIILHGSNGAPIFHGRMDCIFVARVNGRYPNKSQLRIMEKIRSSFLPGKRPRYCSVGTIILAHQEVLGPDLEWGCIDLKIGQGDGKNNDHTFDHRDVARDAFPEDVKQMRGYIGSWGYDQGLQDISAGDRDAATPQVGELHYYTYDHGLKVHHVPMSSDERQDWYENMRKRIARLANWNAEFRQFDRALCNCVARAVFGE